MYQEHQVLGAGGVFAANASEQNTRWGAVYAVALSVAGIITAELLPASLLTPIASDLAISAGMAGQSISATAVAALFASLFTSRVIAKVDRRVVLLSFSVLMALSSALTAIATSFAVLMIARVILGVALGGFWSMAAAVAARLVPPQALPKALSIIFGGVSVALVASAPLGSFLGGMLGWRAIFAAAAVLGSLCWLWQWAALPQMLPGEQAQNSSIVAVAKRPQVGTALLAITTVFAAQFAFFTYMRPFFEGVTHLSHTSLSAILLLFGLGNLAGTAASGPALSRSLRGTLLFAPIALSLSAAGLILLGAAAVEASILTAIWGFAFGMVPVAWSTWIARNLPDASEAAGGLQVAVIQLANTGGAVAGGMLLDRSGPLAPLIVSATLFALTALIVGLGLYRTPRPETAKGIL